MTLKWHLWRKHVICPSVAVRPSVSAFYPNPYLIFIVMSKAKHPANMVLQTKQLKHISALLLGITRAETRAFIGGGWKFVSSGSKEIRQAKLENKYMNIHPPPIVALVTALGVTNGPQLINCLLGTFLLWGMHFLMNAILIWKTNSRYKF